MPPKSSVRNRSFEDFLESAAKESSQVWKRGIPLLKRLSESELKALSQFALQSIEGVGSLEDSNISETLGLPQEEATDAVVTAAMVATSVRAKESPAEIAEIIKKRFSLSEQDVAPLRTLAEGFHKTKDEIIERAERRNLSETILPSFRNLSFVVDVRMKLDDEQLVASMASSKRAVRHHKARSTSL